MQTAYKFILVVFPLSECNLFGAQCRISVEWFQITSVGLGRTKKKLSVHHPGKKNLNYFKAITNEILLLFWLW